MYTLTPSEIFPGFYKIPGYSKYVVNEAGDVINVKKKTKVAGSVNPAGYVNYRLTDDNGYTLTWGRHRLKAYIFKNPGVDVKKLVVNHDNGIKGSDELDNLEWTTHQGNLEHAGRTGLTEKCTPISVRDVDTGVISYFPSIAECARVFGLSKDAINYRVKVGEDRIFPERKQYRVGQNNLPWKTFLNVENALLENSTSKAVIMRSLITLEELYFNQLTSLANYLNVSPSTLSGWMNIPNQPVLPGFLQLKWGHDSTPWRNPIDPILEHEKNSNKRAIVVYNTVTGIKGFFLSALECAKGMGLTPTNLNHRLRNKPGHIWSDGYIYSYYSNSNNLGHFDE
jgi:hypothetical protein